LSRQQRQEAIRATLSPMDSVVDVLRESVVGKLYFVQQGPSVGMDSLLKVDVSFFGRRHDHRSIKT
jgi:hypothetical protein